MPVGRDDTNVTNVLRPLDAGDAPQPPIPGLAVVWSAGRPQFVPIPLGARPVVLGRSRSADVTIDDGGMSSRHLEVWFDGHVWHAHDLGSRNGTWVDGRYVQQATLGASDVLVFGETIALVSADLRPLAGGPCIVDGSIVAGGVVQRILERVASAAQRRMTVLVEGESGTGKEHVAAYYHRHGQRPQKRFVSVDVGSVKGELAAAEYRGVVKGSHSMARESREGFWKQADGGTLFLDELANMPLDVQRTNLRILQEREVLPIGASKPIPVDVDVVAATNKDLKAQIAAGEFLHDLYHRFAAEVVRLPPLRDRPEEIPWLIDTLVRRRDAARRVTRDLVVRALRYDWPGNVRELEQRIGSALLDEGPELAPRHIAAPASGLRPSEPVDVRAPVTIEPPPPAPSTPSLADLEREGIVRALRESGGNVSKAALVLGIDRGTLREKMKKYGIAPRAR